MFYKLSMWLIVFSFFSVINNAIAMLGNDLIPLAITIFFTVFAFFLVLALAVAENFGAKNTWIVFWMGDLNPKNRELNGFRVLKCFTC